MKKIILILLIAASSAFAAPSHKPVVKPVDPPTISQTVVSAYDAEKRAKLIEWIEQLRVKGNEALASATLAQENLAKSEVQRKEAEGNIVLLNVQIKDLTDWGITEQNGRIKAESDLSIVLEKYHFIKFWVSMALALASGGLVGIMIFKFAPQSLNTVVGGAVGLGIPVATAVIVFTFIQVRL